ncbi:MAG: hypothetical protein AAGH53_07900 [Pseudomonadota bacterium]
MPMTVWLFFSKSSRVNIALLIGIIALTLIYAGMALTFPEGL